MNDRLAVPLVLLGLCAMCGCAGWRPTQKSSTLTESREDRSQEAVRDFEERRDAAQLEAALDRWNQGDAARAEAMVAAVVKRKPDYMEARMLLAEILWSRSDAAAEQHLRAVLESNDGRADAHHALGLVLDATGRSEEARQHLSKAAELEPQNEVYRATCDSLAQR